MPPARVPWCSDFSPLLWVLLSHRKLSVFLAVLICLVTSSLTIFFLFPRSIAVQPAGLNSTIVAFDRADIQLNITVGGCLCPWALTPPSQQYSSVALVTLGTSSLGPYGIHRVSETWGDAGGGLMTCVGWGLSTVKAQNELPEEQIPGHGGGGQGETRS